MWVSPNKKIKNLAFLTSQKRSPRHSTWRTLIEFDSFFRMYEVTAACVGKKIRTYLVECFGMEELSMAGFFRLSLVHFHILGHVTEFSVGVLEDLPHPLGEDSRTPGM